MALYKKTPVLFIVMEFPPVNTTGNFRSLKFIKYLSQFGIEPIVITLIAGEAAKIFNAKIDHKLLNEIPKDCSIYRIHCSEEKKLVLPKKLGKFIRIYFSIKDSLASRWKPHLFKEINAIVKKHNPKLIYTSLPPFSCGMLANQISKKFDIPYLIDMRDLWSFFGSSPLPSRLHYWLLLREENKIYSKASKVIGVTPQMVKILKKENPKIDPAKFEYISNGFDVNINTLNNFKFHSKNGKVIIGYTGSFYYEPKARGNSLKPWWKKRGHNMLQYIPTKQDWLYRSPYFFLKSIAEIISRFPAIGNTIEIEFIGKPNQWLGDMIIGFGLQDKVTSHGFVTYGKSIDLQKRWDLVLTTAEKVIDGEHYCLPSKIFDYVALNKPILGFVTNGIQKQFIKESGLGIICDPDNINEAVLSIVNLLTNGKEFQPNTEYLNKFHRKYLAKKLANILNGLVEIPEVKYTTKISIP